MQMTTPPDFDVPAAVCLDPHMSRRRALGFLGMLGAAICAAPMSATAKSLTSFSATGLGVSSGDVLGYAQFLSGLELKHVTIDRILASHAKQRRGVRNSLPPQKLWKNLVKPLRIAEAISERLGEEVEDVISAYRTSAYNSQCGGAASNSQHLRNAALDLVFRSSPSKVGKVARQLRAEGFFKGGVGVYSGFTHVDARGHNADW
jgi:hypothetical protein